MTESKKKKKVLKQIQAATTNKIKIISLKLLLVPKAAVPVCETTDHEILAHAITGAVLWGGGLWSDSQILPLGSRLIAAGSTAHWWGQVKGGLWAVGLHHHSEKNETGQYSW